MLPQKIIQNQPSSNLWAWGIGTSGQLGDGAVASRSSPVQVSITRDWAKVAAGSDFTIAIKNDGTLWGWGSGGATTSYSNLGDNITAANRFLPEQLSSLTNWVSVGAGRANAGAINISGQLWTWGFNNYGGVGDSTFTLRSSPVQVGTLTNWASVTWIRGFNPGEGIAIKTDGTLWVWGRNNNGRGDGNPNTNSINSPVQVGTATTWATATAGSNQVLATRTDGTLWAWGGNFNGELGINTSGRVSSPIQIGALTNWKSITSSVVGHTAGVKTDGTLWVTGMNTSGQLGDNTVVAARSSMVQVGTLTNWASVTVSQASQSGGGQFTIATKTDGTLWGWGFGGQVGDNTVISRSSPVQVGTLTNWSKVSAGGSHTMAIKTDNTLWGWGVQSVGQIGDSTLTTRSSPVQIGTLTNWATAVGGASHTVAIKTTGTLFAWGLGTLGQLGDNTIVTKTSPVQIGTLTNWATVAAGLSHTNAVKTDGTLWGWGQGSSGQIGNNLPATSFSSPVQVGTLTNWSIVAAGLYNAAAVKTDNTLWMWGSNTGGRVGDISIVSRSSPVQLGTLTNWANTTGSLTVTSNNSLATKNDGTLWGWGSKAVGVLGDNAALTNIDPVQVGTLTNWLKVSTGTYHTLAIKTDGTLWSWGYNANGGQLGQNIATIVTSSPAQVGTLTNWAVISAGGVNSKAIKTDGTLWTWGQASSGEMGDNTVTVKSSPVQLGTLTNWAAIGSGTSHVVALKNN